ncbi:MAG: hypothetical protein Q7R48_03140 [bacterium]|nr:hypothetical protein [bacterium]
METTLIFAQTLFYLTVSAAVIAIGVLCAIVTYHLIHIARELEELSRNLNRASSEAGERIDDIIDRLSDLPILAYFLKKRSVMNEKKGRGKSSKK